MTEPVAVDSGVVGAYTSLAEWGRIYYETIGPGPTTLVLVHTAGTDSRVWLNTAYRLARRGFLTVAIDLPGHGRSELPADGPIEAISDFSDSVMRVIEALGIRHVSVMGCSIGGCIAADMACRFGDRIESGICLAASDYNPTVPRATLEMARSDSGSSAWGLRASRLAVASAGSVASAAQLAKIGEFHRRADPLVAGAALRAWNSHDLRGQLGSAACPVSFVLGAVDPFLQTAAAERLACYPAVQRVDVVPDVGHYPMLEMDGFVEYVTGIIEETLASRSAQKGPV